MANNKSARKRIGTNERNRLQNRYYKTSVRTLTKLFFKNLKLTENEQTPQSKEKLQTIVNSIYSFLDKGTKKNIFHKNTAARQKARLARSLSTNS
jgi:small subunit ribosomal protein S20